MLLGRGMRVLHLLVRKVMVTVMVKVDGVLWHSPLRHPPLLGAPPRLRHRYRFRHRHCVLRRSWGLLGAAGAGDAGTPHAGADGDGDGVGVGGRGAVA